MKIGYIVDSSSGLTAKEAQKKGWIFLPLLLTIDNKEYQDGIDINNEKFYKLVKENSACRTSATPPALILEAFKKASKEYDHVVVYALSSKLSSQTANLKTFANDFKNVHVVDSHGVGYAITKDLEEVAPMDDIELVLAKLNELSLKQWGVAFPKQLKWLVKGGRISPKIAAMANLLKIVPIIKFEKGALDKYGKGRVFKKAIIKTIKAVAHHHKNSEFIIYHGKYDGIEETIKDIKEIVGDKITVTHFPPIVASHTGPEVIAIMLRQK